MLGRVGSECFGIRLDLWVGWSDVNEDFAVKLDVEAALLGWGAVLELWQIERVE